MIFTPIDIINTVPSFGLINTISGIYIIIFLLYMLVKNLKKIKQRFSVVTLHLTNKIVNKNDNLRKDALKFLLASLLIAFSIDVVLTKLSDKPIWDYAGYIPGIDPILDFVNINESSVQILNLTSQFLNPFPSDQPSAITDFDDNLTTQSIKPFIDRFC